jgi:tetratricopeptide (TPR) repeat protein
MKIVLLSICLSFVVLFVACEGNQPKLVSENNKGGESGQVKPASSTNENTATSNSSNTPAPAANKQVPEPEKPAELVELEKAYEKNPKDEATKKKLVQATYDLGFKIEMDNSLPPFVKYRQALKLFRKALEIDPEHKDSIAQKEQIENIYRSMGRPVPE